MPCKTTEGNLLTIIRTYTGPRTKEQLAQIDIEERSEDEAPEEDGIYVS